MTYGRAVTSADSTRMASAQTCVSTSTREELDLGFFALLSLLPNSHSWSSKPDHSTMGTVSIWLRYLESGCGGFTGGASTTFSFARTGAGEGIVERTLCSWPSVKPLIPFRLTLWLTTTPDLPEVNWVAVWHGSSFLPFSRTGWEKETLLSKLWFPYSWGNWVAVWGGSSFLSFSRTEGEGETFLSTFWFLPVPCQPDANWGAAATDFIFFPLSATWGEDDKFKPFALRLLTVPPFHSGRDLVPDLLGSVLLPFSTIWWEEEAGLGNLLGRMSLSVTKH